MSVIIGQAGSDENGNITGGQSGDQTGREVYERDWWAMGWTQLVRPKSQSLAEKIANAMEEACANNNIGYDQNERLTLYNAAKKVGFDLSEIKTKCECDCSSLVAVCVIAAGVNVNPDIYTGNEVAALFATGQFDVLNESKYLTSSDYLRRGDILVKQYSHTVIVLTNGSEVDLPQPKPNDSDNVMYAEKMDKSLAGAYTVTTGLNLRRGAGTGYKVITVLPQGATVRNYGYYSTYRGVKWLYVQYGKYVGFCSINYLRKQ